jgi:acylphosphatase
MSESLCRRLVVRGLVQGVGFRFSMQREAMRLGVTGWVRNRRDGTVEAMAAGTPDAVQALVAWARRGPPSSRVDEVAVSDCEGSFRSFELRPTA